MESCGPAACGEIAGDICGLHRDRQHRCAAVRPGQRVEAGRVAGDL